MSFEPIWKNENNHGDCRINNNVCNPQLLWVKRSNVRARRVLRTPRWGRSPRAEFDAIHAHAAADTPQELADILIDLLVKRHPQTREFAALLESRTDWTEVRQQLRIQTLADIKTALTACAPDLDDRRPRMSPS
jgi:hypothetical protein